MTTESALRKALEPFVGHMSSNPETTLYIQSDAIRAARAALALPEAPKECRLAYEFRHKTGEWEERSSGLCIEAFAVAKAQVLAEITSTYRNVRIESRTAAGPWTPHEVQA